MPSWRQLNTYDSLLPGESAVVPGKDETATVQKVPYPSVAAGRFGSCQASAKRSGSVDQAQESAQMTAKRARSSSPAQKCPKKEAKPEFDVIENILQQTRCKPPTRKASSPKKCSDRSRLVCGKASRTESPAKTSCEKKLSKPSKFLSGHMKIDLQDLPHPRDLRSKKKMRKHQVPKLGFMEHYRRELKNRTSYLSTSSLSQLKEARKTLMQKVYGDQEADEHVRSSHQETDTQPSWTTSPPSLEHSHWRSEDVQTSSLISFSSAMQRVPGVLMSPIHPTSPAIYDQASFWQESFTDKATHSEVRPYHTNQGACYSNEESFDEICNNIPHHLEENAALFHASSTSVFRGIHVDSAEE